MDKSSRYQVKFDGLGFYHVEDTKYVGPLGETTIIHETCCTQRRDAYFTAERLNAADE
jgi:hypothetical protein